MGIMLTDVKTTPITVSKCAAVEEKLLSVINDSNLSLGELLYVLASTMLDIGGSLEGIKSKLSYLDVRRRYGVDPTLGNALMAHGVDILDEWIGVPDKANEEGEE